MKKRTALLLGLLMAVSLAFTGCAGGSDDAADADEQTEEEDSDEEEKEDAKEPEEDAGASEDGTKKEGDTFVVGFDAEFPPYGYLENGEYVGFDLSLAEELCARNGWILEKTPIDWDAKDMELESGTIDCIWNGFTITGREDDYTWTEPYLDNSQVVIVAKDSGIETLEDLAGKAVLVQADSSALAALSEDRADLAETFGTLTEIGDYNTAFMNLEAGAADAVALDYGVAMGYINSNDNFVMLDEEISTEQYAVGFKLGNEALRDQVQKTLNEMAEDGTVMKIAEEYEEYKIPEMLLIGK